MIGGKPLEARILGKKRRRISGWHHRFGGKFRLMVRFKFLECRTHLLHAFARFGEIRHIHRKQRRAGGNLLETAFRRPIATIEIAANRLGAHPLVLAAHLIVRRAGRCGKAKPGEIALLAVPAFRKIRPLADRRRGMHRAAEPHGPDIAEERTLHAERRIRQTHLKGPAFLAAHGLVFAACRPVGLVAVLDVENRAKRVDDPLKQVRSAVNAQIEEQLDVVVGVDVEIVLVELREHLVHRLLDAAADVERRRRVQKANVRLNRKSLRLARRATPIERPHRRGRLPGRMATRTVKRKVRNDLRRARLGQIGQHRRVGGRKHRRIRLAARRQPDEIRANRLRPQKSAGDEDRRHHAKTHPMTHFDYSPMTHFDYSPTANIKRMPHSSNAHQ